jgi:ankyrin repeat protein
MTMTTNKSDGGEEGPDRMQLTLLALCYNYDWQNVLHRLELLQDSPDALRIECQAVWNRGRTPLHVAVDHDAPRHVVERLIQAYPQALLVVGTTGMNPLHIACSSEKADVEIVRLLLVEAAKLDQAETMASHRDVDMDTPLHSACRCGAPLEVLRMLLLVYPAAARELDYEGLTPLHRLWVREYVLLGGETFKQVQSEKDLHGELQQAWFKTTMLLYAMQYNTLKHLAGVTFRPLHAMAALDCPRRVLRMACSIYPQQLLEKDENGNTPLLVACQAPVYKFKDIGHDGADLEDKLEDHLYEDMESAANDDHDDTDKMSVSSENSAPTKLPSVIDIFVAACPHAAKIQASNGQTPLQIATASGKTWNQGVGILTEAEQGDEAALQQNMQSMKIHR